MVATKTLRPSWPPIASKLVNALYPVKFIFLIVDADSKI
jgi:hypothetical protein